MRKWIVRAGLVVLIVLVVSQFIPVDRTNPPVESDGSVSDLHFIELDPQATFVPIDAQPDDHIMHLDRLEKADRLAHEALNTGALYQVLALDLLRDLLAWLVLFAAR